MRRTFSMLCATAALVLLPSCQSSNAPHCLTLDGSYDPAHPDIYFVYKAGVNAVATTDTLVSRYGFTPLTVDTATQMVTIPAPQPAGVVSGLVCEPSIWIIGYDGSIQMP